MEEPNHDYGKEDNQTKRPEDYGDKSRNQEDEAKIHGEPPPHMLAIIVPRAMQDQKKGPLWGPEDRTTVTSAGLDPEAAYC